MANYIILKRIRGLNFRFAAAIWFVPWFAAGVHAQDISAYAGRDAATLLDSGLVIHTHVYLGPDLPALRNDRNYTWTKGGKLFTTQGGYGGKLLHGSFDEAFANRNLRALGAYRFGLKQGDWKMWNENGKLSHTAHWRQGILSGPFATYDSLGVKQAYGRHQNNRIDGVYHYLDAGQWKVKRFRAGIERAAKQSFITRQIKQVRNFLKRVF